MIENRLIGSPNTLSTGTLAYKATASGQTLTGGNDAALFAQTDKGRLFASIDFELQKGKACGIRVETALSSGNFKLYAALVGYIKDDNNERSI